MCITIPAVNKGVYGRGDGLLSCFLPNMLPGFELDTVDEQWKERPLTGKNNCPSGRSRASDRIDLSEPNAATLPNVPTESPPEGYARGANWCVLLTPTHAYASHTSSCMTTRLSLHTSLYLHMREWIYFTFAREEKSGMSEEV